MRLKPVPMRLAIMIASVAVLGGAVGSLFREKGFDWLVPAGYAVGTGVGLLVAAVYNSMLARSLLPDHCPHCGHSTKGLPSKRCPECGEFVTGTQRQR